MSFAKIRQMSNLKKLLIFGGIVVVALALALCVQKPEEVTTPPPAQPKELKLSDFPEVFKDNTLIVIGDKASEIELQAVNEIANYLENETGNKPLVEKYSEVSDEDKKNNLIVVGTPNSNPMLKEIYAITDVLGVNETYPGKGKGVLEILRNPWNKNKALLRVAGSDEPGARAGGEIIGEVKDIDTANVVVKWNEINGVFATSIPADKYIFVEFLQEIGGAPVRIDRPAIYSFHNTTGVLEGGNFEINETLVMVIGYMLEVKEPGGGGSAGITPIYTIPSNLNIPLPWKIKYFDTDGTVYLSYENTKIRLKPGEETEKKFTTKWMGYVITYKVKIKNYGFQSKDKIKLWSVGG